MLMESLPFEKSSGRVIHLLKPSGDGVFKMGRGHESQVRICDISVSRVHTLINFGLKEGESEPSFLLEDNLSKFGTLVLPNVEVIHLQPDETKAIQIGRSVVSFTAKLTEVAESREPLTRESSPEMLTDIERIKLKIDETDAKITRLLRCEQEYLN